MRMKYQTENRNGTFKPIVSEVRIPTYEDFCKMPELPYIDRAIIIDTPCFDSTSELMWYKNERATNYKKMSLYLRFGMSYARQLWGWPYGWKESYFTKKIRTLSATPSNKLTQDRPQKFFVHPILRVENLMETGVERGKVLKFFNTTWLVISVNEVFALEGAACLYLMGAAEADLCYPIPANIKAKALELAYSLIEDKEYEIETPEAAAIEDEIAKIYWNDKDLFTSRAKRINIEPFEKTFASSMKIGEEPWRWFE